MQYVSDLHLHSKYSRAVSRDMILPTMARWGKKKGIGILSTGDWTHPLWFREIRSQLEEESEGLFKLKSQNSNAEQEPLFLLSTEVASIYKQGEKLRRIHNLVFAPNFGTAEKINKELVGRGCNLHADGRPIIGISSKNLLEILLSIDKKILLIPCHVWTPHFGIYGSASGFESLEEAFEELTRYVYGIETGLSSDPEMNWQMKELVDRSILSFSDAHSPAKIGREATVFELEEPTYENIRKAIMRHSKMVEDRRLKVGVEDRGLRVERDIYLQASTIKNPSSTFHHLPSNRIIYTIEFYPEEGKYHFSGHRNCQVVRGPDETRKDGATCPVCRRSLTEGVLYRVQQLGGKSLTEVSENKISSNGIKWFIDKAKRHPPFVKLVPLLEIIAEGLGSTVTSPKAKEMFDNLCREFGSEVNALLKTPIEEIEKIAEAKIVEGISRVRKGDIVIDPGYDGEYGKVKIWNEKVQSSSRQSRDKIQKGEEVSREQLGLGF